MELLHAAFHMADALQPNFFRDEYFIINGWCVLSLFGAISWLIIPDRYMAIQCEKNIYTKKVTRQLLLVIARGKKLKIE